MISDYDKLMNIFHPIRWSQWLSHWLVVVLLFTLSVILNVLLGLILGAMLGWIFQTSISEGIALFGIYIPAGKICKLAALVGIVSGFVAALFKNALIVQRKNKV